MKRIVSVLLLALLMLAAYPPNPGAQGDSLPIDPAGHNRVGVYLTSYALTKRHVVEALLAARKADKINTVVINVKNMHGEVTYDTSVPLAGEIGAATGRLDLSALVPALRDRGFYVIARQVLFYDPLLAEHLGRPDSWVPVSDSTATEYNLAIAQEVVSFGFDELQFDYIRYADEGLLDAVYEDRYAAVNQFLARARQSLADRITLSADVFGRVLWPWNERRIDPIGQSLEDMCPYLDYVSPMVYPSHYAEQVYRDDPYRTVTEALRSGKARVTARYRPFLQAFDLALPLGMSLEMYIREQIRAAHDAGADGYLFWHPSCEYDTLYRALD